MNDTLGQFFVLLGGIITVAIVATLVSQKSQTPNVISSFFSGFSQSIGAAVSPITGGSSSTFSPIFSQPISAALPSNIGGAGLFSGASGLFNQGL